MIQELTENNLISVLTNEKRPVIIQFFSDWCPPCKKMLPIIEEIAQERQDICVCRINTQKETTLTTQFSINNIPTFMIIKEGKIQTTMIGAHSKQAILNNI